MKKITAIVIGFGGRGHTYAQYAIENPEEFQIVAVAEPYDVRRKLAMELLNIPEENAFTDWHEFVNKPKMADVALICTQDAFHVEPAIKMLEKGYDLLLEKPIAPTAEECKAVAMAAEKYGRQVIVCHVLRYGQFWKKIKEIILNGDLGEIQSITHVEGVGNVHQSHSFVRGNWRNSKESSFMFLAKSCHDADIVQWLIDKPCKKVQSFGSLSYFTPENRPEGAPDRCTDGCPAADTCIYNAIKIYHDDKSKGNWYRPYAVQKLSPATDEEVMEVLRNGPYGRCVFACDNDVVDHQVVNMEFEGGVTASITMNAFNKGGRNIQIHGTMGSLTGVMGDNSITVYSFKTKESTTYNLDQIGEHITSGHGGGDTGIVRDLVRHLNGISCNSINNVMTSYMNHLICFAAEESRLTDKVVDLKAFSDSL